MSRTTIIPTVQTKANQETDLYLKAQNPSIEGNLTVNGNIIMNDTGDEIVCKVQGTVGGEGCIQINQVTGNIARWAIGTQVAEGGANSGNNFRIFSYSDGGGFLSAPLQITRSTGNITVPAGMAVGTVLNVGLQAGAGTINVVGPSGAGQVYDEIYNRPGVGVDFLMFTAFNDGTTGGVNNAYVCTRTGTYILSLTVQAYATLFSWTPGSTSMLYALTANGGATMVAGGQLYVGMISDPNLMPAIGVALPGNMIEYQQDVLVQLTAGQTYGIICGSNGTPNLGVGGNVAIVVQELIA